MQSTNNELSSNQVEDIQTRLKRAQAFLQKNPTEKAITAARIYSLQPTTLRSSLTRAPTSGIRGGHNKVLQDHHKEAIHQFIRSLLAYGIQPTPQIVYNSICSLKRVQERDNFKAPSMG